jgi:hypothetical protein
MAKAVRTRVPPAAPESHTEVSQRRRATSTSTGLRQWTLKEDFQVGCTGKTYWGAVKKACGVDQYGALPMDGGGIIQGPDGARGGASRGAHISCEERKASQRVGAW